jgi:transposase
LDWIWAIGGIGFVCWVRVGIVVEEGSVANNRVALSELSSRYPGALIVMEAGCHSPWVSRHLEQAGCEVIVSNPRKTRAIYQHERKSDRRDALMLARIARMEPALLYPVRHGSEEAQQDLLRIKLPGASAGGIDQFAAFYP